jgi:hypothetical protein
MAHSGPFVSRTCGGFDVDKPPSDKVQTPRLFFICELN